MADEIPDYWVDTPSTSTALTAANLNAREELIHDTAVTTASAYADTLNAKVTTNAQTGTTYTLVLADAGGRVQVTNASAQTVTIPPNASVAFPVGTVIEVAQAGAGATSVAQGAGVTLRPSSPQTVAGQYKSLRLVKVLTNEWWAE